MGLIEVICVGCGKKQGLTETAVDLNRYTATKYVYCEACGGESMYEPYIRVKALKRTPEKPTQPHSPQ